MSSAVSSGDRFDPAEQGALVAYLLKWIVLGAIVGVIVGFGSAAFLKSLDWATRTRGPRLVVVRTPARGVRRRSRLPLRRRSVGGRQQPHPRRDPRPEGVDPAPHGAARVRRNDPHASLRRLRRPRRNRRSRWPGASPTAHSGRRGSTRRPAPAVDRRDRGRVRLGVRRPDRGLRVRARGPSRRADAPRRAGRRAQRPASSATSSCAASACTTR